MPVSRSLDACHVTYWERPEAHYELVEGFL